MQYGARLLGAMVDELELVQADSSQSAQMGPMLPSLLAEARRQLSAVQARTLGQPAGQVSCAAACLRLQWPSVGARGCRSGRGSLLSCGWDSRLLQCRCSGWLV